MNKLFYFLLLLLLFPAIVSAEVKYTRSFVDPLFSSPIILDIAVNDYDEDINCGGLKFWGVQAIEHETGNRFFGSPRFVSSAVLSQTFTLDLPIGDYEELTFICSDDGEDEVFQFWSIENDLAGDQVIFIVKSTPTIDIIESGEVSDNNSVPVVPVPEPTPAPVIQENEDGSTTIIAI